MPASPPSTPLYRHPADIRRAHALMFVGEVAEVSISPLRCADDSLGHTLTGTVITVAHVQIGTGTDVIVVRPLGAHGPASDRGYSLAQVHAIRHAIRLSDVLEEAGQ